MKLRAVLGAGLLAEMSSACKLGTCGMIWMCFQQLQTVGRMRFKQMMRWWRAWSSWTTQWRRRTSQVL